MSSAVNLRYDLVWLRNDRMKTKVFLIVASVVVLLLLLAAAVTIVVVGIHNRKKYALFDAAEGNELNQAKMLIQQGAPINQKNANDFGFTPLIVAIYHDNTNTAYYLIDAGADVNLADNRGRTPLMWATDIGDDTVPFVKCLLAHGARLDAKDTDGNTALRYAQAGQPSPQLLALLQSAQVAQETKAASNPLVGTNAASQKP
jgi:ankyrin repeat protein